MLWLNAYDVDGFPISRSKIVPAVFDRRQPYRPTVGSDPFTYSAGLIRFGETRYRLPYVMFLLWPEFIVVIPQ